METPAEPHVTQPAGYRAFLPARRILALREDHRRAITGSFGRAAGNGRRMAGCGILVEQTGRARNRRFTYQSYIELFHDDEPEPAR